MAERLQTRVSSPSYQAYQILYVLLTIAPIIAGLDKFTHFLVNWDQYLSPVIARMLPVSAHVAGPTMLLIAALGDNAVTHPWLQCVCVRREQSPV